MEGVVVGVGQRERGVKGQEGADDDVEEALAAAVMQTRDGEDTRLSSQSVRAEKRLLDLLCCDSSRQQAAAEAQADLKRCVPQE